MVETVETVETGNGGNRWKRFVRFLWMMIGMMIGGIGGLGSGVGCVGWEEGGEGGGICVVGELMERAGSLYVFGMLGDWTRHHPSAFRDRVIRVSDRPVLIVGISVCKWGKQDADIAARFLRWQSHC